MCMNYLRAMFCLMAGCMLPSAALADQGVWHQGNLSIRYNALPASALPLASTQQLGVKHSTRQGLLNILVMRGTGPAATSVAADISARVMTENGSPVRIRVRRVRDANGISYLGTFAIEHSGKLRFDLDITAQGTTTRHIQFQHDFVVD